MTRRGGWVVIVIAIAALAGVWQLLPAGSPAIYDGNCIADPYETVGSSPAPQPTASTFPMSKSVFPASEVYTSETPPQAQIIMESGSFDTPTALTISITPVPAPSVKPPNGTIEGNVYRFSAVNADGSAATPKANVLLTIVLRGTASIPAPTIDRFNGTMWTPLETANSGCGNTFLASSTQLGEFAAVAPGGSKPQPAASSGGFPVVAIVGALVLLLVIAIVVLFSLDRGRRRVR